MVVASRYYGAASESRRADHARRDGGDPGDGAYLASGLNVTDAPPDFSRERVSDYSAVEYYPAPSMAPAQYTQTGSSCGVLLLWTRQRR